MTMETPEWLRDNVLVGYVGKRGGAWWLSRGFGGALDMSVNDDGQANHFDGPVPIERVRDLFAKARGVSVPLMIPNAFGVVETVEGVEVSPDYIVIPDRQAIVRQSNGHVYGIFKAGYKYHDLDEFVTNSIATLLDDDLQIGSAGLLKSGAVGWVSVEVPENIVTPDGIEFRPFLYGMTSHDGTLATQFGRCVTNIVCDNTQRAALSEKGQKVKLKHTANSLKRIADTRSALAIVHSEADDFVAWTQELLSIEVKPRQFSKFLDLWSPVPTDSDASKRAVTMAENRRQSLTELYKSDPRVKPWTGTGWGVVQAVNTFDQHLTSVRQGFGDDDRRQAFARWERSLLGAANGDLDARTDDVVGMLHAAVGK